MIRIKKRFGVVARDCPFEQLSQYIESEKERRFKLVDGTDAVICFDGEMMIAKVYKMSVDKITLEGEIIIGRWDTVNRKGYIFVAPLSPEKRHECVIDGHIYDIIVELDSADEDVGDNVIARAKAALHKQRETGHVPQRSQEEEEALRKSELAAILREGSVQNDDPELLNALLRFHRAEVAARRKLLVNFFESWSLEDLRLLFHVTCGGRLSEQDAVSSHSFVKRATAWQGIANSQGSSLWRDSLKGVIERKEQGQPGDMDLELKWYLLMEEYKQLYK